MTCTDTNRWNLDDISNAPSVPGYIQHERKGLYNQGVWASVRALSSAAGITLRVVPDRRERDLQ